MTDDVNVGLDVRLDNRHLDLRRSHANAMFQLRVGSPIRKGAFTSEGFQEINSPKIIAAAAEGGTNLFPMKYFETDIPLESPQLYKQLAVLGGLERFSKLGLPSGLKLTPTGTRTVLSFDIEGAWMDDEDVGGCRRDDQPYLVQDCRERHGSNRCSKRGRIPRKDPVTVEAPTLPFPRIPYCEAIEIVKQEGRD